MWTISEVRTVDAPVRSAQRERRTIVDSTDQAGAIFGEHPHDHLAAEHTCWRRLDGQGWRLMIDASIR